MTNHMKMLTGFDQTTFRSFPKIVLMYKSVPGFFALNSKLYILKVSLLAFKIISFDKRSAGAVVETHINYLYHFNNSLESLQTFKENR